jgi:hypothetical protein
MYSTHGSNIPSSCNKEMNRSNTVGIAHGCELDCRGVGVWIPRRASFISLSTVPTGSEPNHLLSSGYLWLFLWGYCGRGLKLTTQLPLVPKSRIHGSIHSLPLILHGLISIAQGNLYFYTYLSNKLASLNYWKRLLIFFQLTFSSDSWILHSVCIQLKLL